jgi:hypothetical protein
MDGVLHEPLGLPGTLMLASRRLPCRVLMKMAGNVKPFRGSAGDEGCLP